LLLLCINDSATTVFFTLSLHDALPILIAGAVLAILEILVSGFILLGFAIGAALTGLLLWLGVLGGSLATLILVFAVGSLLAWLRSEEHTSELQSRENLVCRLLLEKKK